MLVISHLGDGGAERVASALVGFWDQAGFEVTLLTIASRAHDLYHVAPGVRRVALDLLRPSRNVAEGLVHASCRVLALRRALTQLRPDLVVSFIEDTNILSLLATAGAGVPVFVCERSDPRQRRMKRPWARSLLRRLLYPRAAGVVVQTESVAAWARTFSSHVHVIPNFVERPLRAATPGVDEGARKLMAMGRLVPEKGFDLLIEAFASIAESHPDWSLTILGEGPERKRLEALVSAHRLQDRVSMPGRATDAPVQLSAAHAFALSSRFEGFPNALLEAMACGLPVVAFDCPSGPAEIITHERNGILVRAGDVYQLAAELDRVMTSAAERVRLGQSAREIAIRLAPEPVLELWFALLRGVERR